ncbi:NADPH-dependent FMN reductase [Propioniciclava soli]|uniref:NAD(P)H-dependent oxidoreductase n=1 Tax=Propioniciclava soli TaxID=2775081 RepID=A0ABZ3C868_9ACTN|nr:NAD(P)H-dependent oxidoreductase [Propioniciclava soli]
MKIGIIIGSIREGRAGESVGAWVFEDAEKREGASYELIDLKDFDVPLLTDPRHPMSMGKSYDDERVQAWSDAIDACDAYVFVTPEYNHGVPGAFKNAVDVLGGEWMGKAVAFVGYGSVGGVRAIENWRTVLANFQMYDVRPEVNLNLFTDFTDGQATPDPRHRENLAGLFDALEEVGGRLAS